MTALSGYYLENVNKEAKAHILFDGGIRMCLSGVFVALPGFV